MCIHESGIGRLPGKITPVLTQERIEKYEWFTRESPINKRPHASIDAEAGAMAPFSEKRNERVTL
jgi:hypothetical protein